MIPVFKPKVAKNTKKYVNEVIDSGWWGLGSKTEEFEEKFAKYIGAEYAVAINSCTAALHLACELVNKKYKIDKYYVPAMTFISTALAPIYSGAEVELVDIDPKTQLIDPSSINYKNRYNQFSIIPVHYGGRYADTERFEKFVHIEDCAHAAGSKLPPTSALRCWSFHAVKNLPTGDGGMITTNNKKDYEELKKMRWLGISKSTFERAQSRYGWDYDIDSIGYKYHMNDLTAAIGLAQLEELDEHNIQRKEIARNYYEALKDVKWIKLPKWEEDISWHLMYINLAKNINRKQFIDYMLKRGISVGVHYKPLYYYDMFHSYPLEHTENMFQKIVTLPLYPDLTEEDQSYIISTILKYK